MTVFVCIDDRGGMLFGNKRQSRDSILLSDMANTVGEGLLYISDFSESLIARSDMSAVCVPYPLDTAGEGDFVFNECFHIKNHTGRINRLVIYKWNRRYPYDFALDIDPVTEGFSLKESYDFVGSSHDKITKEIYEK